MTAETRDTREEIQDLRRENTELRARLNEFMQNQQRAREAASEEERELNDQISLAIDLLERLRIRKANSEDTGDKQTDEETKDDSP